MVSAVILITKRNRQLAPGGTFFVAFAKSTPPISCFYWADVEPATWTCIIESIMRLRLELYTLYIHHACSCPSNIKYHAKVANFVSQPAKQHSCTNETSTLMPDDIWPRNCQPLTYLPSFKCLNSNNPPIFLHFKCSTE